MEPMGSTAQEWQIPEGTDVVGADGDKVGKVVAANESYVVVEKGFFFPTDYYIPTSAITSFDGDKVYLSVTKDEALNQGWDVEPAVSGTTYETRTGAYTTGTAGGTTTGLTDDVDVSASTSAGRYQSGGTDVSSGETLRVPVHEEELTATKRAVEQGQVRIAKDVVAEEQTLEVPVTEERVRVERRVVDRDAAPDATAFQEGTIEVPVRGEEVDIQKRVRVAEEIEVGKEAVQRTERVADTVRREEVHVEDQTSAEVTDASTGTTATTRRTDRGGA